jgi:hypothetical protein
MGLDTIFNSKEVLSPNINVHQVCVEINFAAYGLKSVLCFLQVSDLSFLKSCFWILNFI